MDIAAGDSIPIHAEITNVSSHDLLIGRNLWMNDSPSHITLFVTPTGSSNTMPGESGAVDGLGPGQNLAKSMLDWFLLLAPGNSYGAGAGLLRDLGIGTYKVRAIFESSGIDSDSRYNPLRLHPEELEKFRAQNWEGIIVSNDLTFRIVPRSGNSDAPSH